MILVPLLNPKFATGLAAIAGELRVRGTSKRDSGRAQSLRSLAHGGRSRGQVPRRRLPRGAARCLRALRRDGSADPARGIEILERRIAGTLRYSGSGAAP